MSIHTVKFLNQTYEIDNLKCQNYNPQQPLINYFKTHLPGISKFPEWIPIEKLIYFHVNKNFFAPDCFLVSANRGQLFLWCRIKEAPDIFLLGNIEEVLNSIPDIYFDEAIQAYHCKSEILDLKSIDNKESDECLRNRLLSLIVNQFRYPTLSLNLSDQYTLETIQDDNIFRTAGALTNLYLSPTMYNLLINNISLNNISSSQLDELALQWGLKRQNAD